MRKDLSFTDFLPRHRALEITSVQEETLFRSLKLYKTFLSRSCATHAPFCTKLLHEGRDVFMICSPCTHIQQTLLFCLLVAGREWVLLAVRHKDPQSFSITYWWRSTKLQTTEAAAEKFSNSPLTLHCFGQIHKEKREWVSWRSQMHFLLFHFLFFSLPVILWSGPVWSCYYPEALSVCSCLFRSLCDKG